MLDPQYLAHCADELEDLFAELEISILEDVSRRVAENNYSITSTAQHQLNRAKALGLQYDEMQKQVADILKISESKVSSIITEASFNSVEKDNEIFKKAYEKGFIPKFDYQKDELKKIILLGIEATNKEIRNICKTSAKSANKMFSNALDNAYLSVTSGAFSQQEAVKTVATDIGKQGIKWIDYKSGAHRRVDSAVRNALRTGVNQTACRCQDKNFADMGGNLVITTSHMGARETHASWQGLIFWRKKKHKNYSNFEQATGYGTGDGLGGWNCRHSFYPFFEGLSSKSFEQYDVSENQERYELDQEQRYNERAIREWKRRSAVNKSAGVDNSKEARKVREWQQRQSELLKKHPELKRNYARESIVKSNSTRGLAANNKYYDGIKSSEPELVGRLTKTDDQTKEMVLRAYEKQIYNLDYEVGIVITAKGEVYRVKGTSNTCDITQLGNKLQGATATHNHPINETQFSFSSEDRNLFVKYLLKQLCGVDEKYRYMLNLDKDNIDSALGIDIFNATEELYAHNDNITICNKLHIGYRRWENDK